ncbi:hypothetical protein EYF80_068054 [Liparis tanakae]|uniref:Uncharacterized protein n=1 Tax=Liparis tanakae TaxID=230148 RepID=A0A4Z2DZ72_9TELE|nr:hypothetical protein EYF80_068054 [Liparis tanakae]
MWVSETRGTFQLGGKWISWAAGMFRDLRRPSRFLLSWLQEDELLLAVASSIAQHISHDYGLGP